MASGLRPRTKINFKRMHEGDPAPRSKVRQTSKPEILDETYYVERLISRKETSQSVNLFIYLFIYFYVCLLSKIDCVFVI